MVRAMLSSKKAQIKERVAKINQLKPLTIQYEGQEISLTSQKLSELMQKAVQEELKQINGRQNNCSHLYLLSKHPFKN